MWTFRGANDDEEVRHLDLVIVDDEEHPMYVEIPPDAISILQPKLREGIVVTMKKFLVERAKSVFRPVQQDLMIKLDIKTEINQVVLEPLGFPKYVYSFTPFEKLGQHLNKKDKFLYVIGRITAISNTATVNVAKNKRQIKRVIILEDLRGQQLEVSLFGARATEFNGKAVHEAGQESYNSDLCWDFIQEVHRKTIPKWNVSMSMVINEEEIPDIIEFNDNQPDSVDPVKEIKLEDDVMNSDIKQMTVLQLKGVDAYKDFDKLYQCTVTLTRLAPNQGWWYAQCRGCHATLRFSYSGYKCDASDCPGGDIEYKYKIALMGSDDTYELEFVLFAEKAQRLIGKPVDALRNMYAKYDTPPEILKLVGQKYTFIVKVSAKQTIKILSTTKNPSFEVISVVQQHGMQDLLPAIQRDEIIPRASMRHGGSHGQKKSSRHLTPLVPIRAPEDQKLETTRVDEHNVNPESEPMDIDLKNLQQETSKNKRASTFEDDDLDDNDDPTSKAKKKGSGSNKRTKP